MKRDTTELGIGLDIDLDAWLREIESSRAVGDPGLTTTELQELWGVGRDVLRRRLRESLAAGIAVNGWAYRQSINGRRQRVPVYRPVGKTGKSR